LAKHGIHLNGVDSLRGVVDAFRGRVFYEWDLGRGALDYVKPPIVTLNDKQGDCEDLAVLSAQAVEHALGPLGWRAAIVSYLAADFRLSHHVCAATDREGRIWAIQPQPMRGQDADPLPGFAFRDHGHLARTVASWYGTSAVAYDVRGPRWNPIQPWRLMETQP
jgi:hypothetical protein